MATAPSRQIEAAGAVLWRPALGGVGAEVALVHRPKYDDWSVPKGKLEAGEHAVVGAVREVAEETGFRGPIGRALGEIRYLKDGRPKRVRYWAMRADEGEFTPTDEVDQLMWLPPREAARHLVPNRDERDVLETFALDPVPTIGHLLVRHASAGERGSYPGDDDLRPLDDLGREQAGELVQILAAFGICRVVSADVTRCVQTVAPFAAVAGVTVVTEPLLSEAGFADHPDAAVDRLLTLYCSDEPIVMCSQGKAIPGLMREFAARLGSKLSSDPKLRKGAFFGLHREAGTKRLVALDRYDAPA